MRNKDLIKKLSMFDPEGIVVLHNSYGTNHKSLSDVEQDEGVHDFDGYDLLSDWKNVKEMEDFYGSSDSDPLAFVSLIVLS